MTVCLYLPDGRVGVHVQAAEIANNDAFDAGGMSSTCVEPFERLDVDVRGQGRHARRPAPDGRPEEGVHREPVRRVRGAHRVHGRVRHVRRRARRAAREAGRGVRQGPLRAAHRRQGHASASATRSGRSTASASATTRGARATGRRPGTTAGSPPTSAPTSASWARASPAATATAPAAASCGTDGQLHLCNDFEIATEWEGDDTLPPVDLGHAALRRQGVEGHRQGARPHPAAQPPPDPDGDMLVTRISEGMTEWTLDDGRVGYGLSRVPRPDHRRRPRGHRGVGLADPRRRATR